jgi:type IV pilus assembly protein PilB
VEAARNPWPALGTLLVRDGVITAEQLEFALAAKRRSPERRLGEILVDHEYCTQAEIAVVLAEQHELEYVSLASVPVESDAAALLPLELARRYTAIPVRFLPDGSVLVAVADPTNVLQSDEIRLALGLPVRVAVSAQDAIEYAIERFHEGIDLDVTEADAAPLLEDHTDIGIDHETPAVAFVNRTISRALDLGASDIHFGPQQRRIVVRARIDGVMREISSIAGTYSTAVASRLKIMAGLDIAERRAPQDGRVSVRRGQQAVDVRVAVLPTTNGEKITLRLLNQSQAPSSLDELEMWPRSQEALYDGISKPFGSVIVVGPTGSGKTTTLYACLNMLNSPERSIVTIEDPVEYRLQGLDQIDVNPRAGLTFASGLRTILRSDPDVVLVGEIRDEETADIAFRAAMTGHLVLSTLHAQTASTAMQRLLDMDVDRSVIASAVNCFVAQRLVRRLCERCREPEEASDEMLRELGAPPGVSGLTVYRAAGCQACNGIGYRGRIALYEVLRMTDRVISAIGSPATELEALAISEGMLTLRDDAVRLVVAGITTPDEVRRVIGSKTRGD